MKIELEFPEEITEPLISVEFLQGMLDRMAVSYFKYGPVTPEAIAKCDMRATTQLRFDRYHDDHNTEWLMDVANFAMIEFMCPSYADSHFRATEGAESPGVVAADGTITQKHARDLPARPVPEHEHLGGGS